MTTVKISQLPAITGANTATTDVLPIVDTSLNVTNKITREEFFKNIQSDVEIADKIVHSGDTNTAIRFPAADTVTVETSGFERMRIDSSGNVGIGVSPATDGAIHVHRSGASFPTIKITNGTTGTANSDGFDLVCGSAGEAYVYNRENQPLIFGTNATERMRIDSSGNVGIGTSGPTSAKLVITAGDTAQTAQFQGATGRIRVRGYQDATNGGIIDSTNTAENAYAPLTLQASALRLLGNNATGITIDASGNLGLGVTPSAWGSGFKALQLNSGASLFGDIANLYLNSNTYWNGSNWIYTTTNFAARYQQASGQHVWYNAPSGTAGNAITFTQAMTLDASGNLLLGTVGGLGQSQRVQATGSYLAFSDGAGLRMLNTDLTSGGTLSVNAGTNTGITLSSDSGPTIFHTVGTERARIDASGNLLVGTTSSPTSPSNTAVIVSGGVRTASNLLSSIGSGTATTAFSITAGNRGRYEVVAMIVNSGDASLYSAISTVLWDGSTGRAVSNNGTNLTITLSGSNVQVTQTSGSAQNVYWSVQRIAL